MALTRSSNLGAEVNPRNEQQRPPPPPPPRVGPRPSPLQPGLGTSRHEISTQTLPFEGRQIGGEGEVEEESSNDPTILNIRSLTGERIQILVSNGMAQEDLSRSIAHAVLSPLEGRKLVESWSNLGTIGNVDWSRIAGLFREKDGVFVPFTILLNNCEPYSNDIFRVSRWPAHFPQKKNESPPYFNKRELVFYGLITIYLGWMLATGENIGQIVERGTQKVEMTFLKLVNLPNQAMDNFIDYPLKELYRSGPAIIGWEGQPLPQICAQITHMGDHAFWSRNKDECQKIFDTKEMAALHIRRPIVLLILAYLLFLAIRNLVHTRAVREQNRPHPEMVEIYQTFKMLMRVLQRGMNAQDDEKRRGIHRY